MAALVLTDTMILVGGNDISEFSGSLQIDPTVQMVEGNVFRTGGYTRQYPGLRSNTMTFDGLADFTAGPSATFTPATVGTQYAVAALPTGGSTAGDPAIFTRGIMSKFATPGGAVGAMASFTMQIDSDMAEVNGQVAAPLVARTTTANGAILTMTGPLTGETIYCGLHITAVSGGSPSMTVALQSATLIGFGSPTTRGTFTAATTTGWQWLSVAGPVTDGFWRVTFTISGSTPSFTCAAVLGVT